MSPQQQADELLAEFQKQKVPARYLQSGDRVGSGEIVAWVGFGVRTPRGKVEVLLEKDGGRRLAVWNASTLISVQRNEKETAQ